MNVTTSTPFLETYTYSKIGNLLTKSDVGAFQYSGNLNSSFANPHAATLIAGMAQTYDKNGNLLTDGIRTNTWDYKNRLTQSIKSGITHRFAYDHTQARVSYFDGTATTTYPNDYYDTQGATTTKHIYAQGALIATIEKSPATTTPAVFIVHTDHLGGTSAVTNAQGLLAESLTYRPFGAPRIDQTYGSFTESRKYIGQYYDDETDLSYLNARYYDGARGQFLSQDPVFLGIGVDPRTQEALRDPQSLNSYSYAKNNPITLSDPNGEWVHIAIGAGAGILGQYGYDVYNNINNDGFSAGAFVSNLSSGKTYLTRGAQGAAIAATGGAVAAAGTSVGIGVVGQSVVMGGVTGAVGAGGNAFLGESVTPGSVAVDSVVGALTFGASSVIPKVPGRLPNFGTQAFVSGKHTQQSAMNLGVDAGGNYISAIMNDISKQIKDLQKQVSNLKQSNNNSSNKKKNK